MISPGDSSRAPRSAAPAHDGELAALLELRMLPGLGDERLRELVERHGSARAALDAPPGELGPKATRLRGSRRIRDRVARGIEVIRRLDVAVLREPDAEYPPALRTVENPPYVLFARGRLELLERPAVAVVGARRHTQYGASVTRMLAGALARAGMVVVSGLARGIDGLAHDAALAEGMPAGGTLAVLGCGIDVAYPLQNQRLQERIAREGLLLSEFVPGEPALPHHFPRRNRVIAGLVRGVVVVEATLRSGSLITAHHALDLGREVLAVPGPIGRDTSQGTNLLVYDGARILLDVEDVFDELGLPLPPDDTELHAGPPTDLAPELRRLWDALADEPRHVDSLAASCGLSPAATLVGLLQLELDGHVRQLPGKRFVVA